MVVVVDGDGAGSAAERFQNDPEAGYGEEKVVDHAVDDDPTDEEQPGDEVVVVDGDRAVVVEQHGAARGGQVVQALHLVAVPHPAVVVPHGGHQQPASVVEVPLFHRLNQPLRPL